MSALRKKNASFNSRTPGGVRRGRGVGLAQGCHGFNSRTPGGVRLHHPPIGTDGSGVSIHAPREGCDVKVSDLKILLNSVSIHAPREGCDYLSLAPLRHCGIVSIHAPREGCDYRFNPFRLLAYQFQFTHPGRGATSSSTASLTRRRFQFTHPGRGATASPPTAPSSGLFQFTHPGRGATPYSPQTA